jgi:peroxin-1
LGSNNGTKTDGGKERGEKGIPEFSYFRYGDDPSSSSAQEATAVATSVQLTERAVIAQKIAALQALRRKQKALQRPGSRDRDHDGIGNGNGKEDDDGERKDPQIHWKHIETSLTTGRSSISAQERVRLQRIYREFVDGRDGDLQDGQGGTEIGGRSSLM